MTEREHQITLTQYLRPDGRTRNVSAPVTAEYSAKAAALIEQDVSFSCEILRTGEVAIYAEYLGQDIVIEISQNDETIHAALEYLIDRAASILEARRLGEQVSRH